MSSKFRFAKLGNRHLLIWMDKMRRTIIWILQQLQLVENAV